mgnify:CR=1 FL=1
MVVVVVLLVSPVVGRHLLLVSPVPSVSRPSSSFLSASPLGRSVQNPLESPGGPGIPHRLSRVGRFVPAAVTEFRSRLRMPPPAARA